MRIFFITALLFFLQVESFATPIISGISTNDIYIGTKFNGAKILLFGAKGDAGNIVIAVRGPKKDFLVTKKKKLLGIWYNGSHVAFEDAYSFYSLFSTYSEEPLDDLISSLELGKNNIEFKTNDDVSSAQKNEFQLQLIEQLEKKKLYATGNNKIDFLDETLFKVVLDFPKNIARGTYNVEIYLINDGGLMSFQSIPIYVRQVGFSARVFDFAYEESFLYGLLAIAIALVAGWLANYLFARFIGK